MVEVEVVPGNHDGGLAELLPPGLKMHPPAGFVLDGVGYFHGHTWPHPSLLKAEELVAGHIHPSIRLSDPLGVSWNEQVWVRTTTSKEAVHLQYREEMPTPGLIILPAFNPLSGSLPLNTSGETDRGPILRLAELALARMYLLDGTDLGDLKSIGTKRTRPRRSRTEGYIEDKEGRQRHE
jgi:metallophosphoesterase superfamily enzyme